MFGNFGNMGNMMRQAQAMQEKLQKVQDELAQAEVTGEAGAGLVKVTVNGAHEVKRVSIDDKIFGDDKEMCEDLIAAAFNDAQRRLDEASKAKMGELTKGLKLPPGMKLPF